MKRILLAGITGYLGQCIAKELQRRGYPVRGIARTLAKLQGLDQTGIELIQANG